MIETFVRSNDDILELIAVAREQADQAGMRLLLDAFCCQGAMTSGYQDAGFIVFGVDIDAKALRKYCGDFKVNHDAVSFIRQYGYLFDAISASPPCQDYSLTARINTSDFPRLIEPTREALVISGRPFVIENVVGAANEMFSPIMLCGTSFGIHTNRHRLFEFGGWAPGLRGAPEPVHHEHIHPTVKMGRALKDGDFYHAVGNFQQVEYVRKDLNLPWMNRDGLRECAPRQYAQYVGIYLQQTLEIFDAARRNRVWV